MRLIDADELIESMGVSDAVKWGNKDGYQQDRSYSTLMCYEIKDYIDSQPTIDAVLVKHGMWEYIPSDGKFRAILICSKCKKCVGEYNRYKFCPHCGARMDLEEQHDD